MSNAQKALYAQISAMGAPAAQQLSTNDGTGLDYAAGLNKGNAKNVFTRQDFVQDVYDYYYERDGKTFNTVDEAKDYFMEDRRWRNMNLVSIGRDLYDANTQNDEQTTRLARLQTTFDAMPNFYEDGGDGWQGFGTNALATLADPINLIGFGSGGVAAREAAKQVIAKGGRKALTKSGAASMKKAATKAALKSGVYKGALYEGAASGVAEGVLDAGIQARNTELGLQDGYSLTQGAIAVGGGALIGGGMGAVLGGVAAVAPNPLAKGRSATEMGMIDGRNQARATLRADAEVDADFSPEVAPEAELTEAQQITQRLVEQQAAVNARTSGTRGAAALSADDLDPDTPTADGRMTGSDVDALDLGEEDVLDLAAQQAVNLDRLASELDAEALKETKNLDKVNGLNERARKMRNASSNISNRLQKFLSDDEITTPDVIQEIKLITDQTNKDMKLIGFDPDAAQPTGNDGGGSVRNKTDAEVKSDFDATNNEGARPGDGGVFSGDDAAEFSDPQSFNSNGTLAGRGQTVVGDPIEGGPDNKMGPQRPDQDLTNDDAEFAERLKVTQGRKNAMNDAVAAQEDLLKNKTGSLFTKSEFDIEGADRSEGIDAEMSSVLDGGLQPDTPPEVRQRFRDQFAGTDQTEEDVIPILVEGRQVLMAEQNALRDEIAKDQAILDELKQRRIDNEKVIDTETSDYQTKRDEALAARAKAEEDAAINYAAERVEAEEIEAQRQADKANPVRVYEALKGNNEVLEYLESIGISDEEIAAYKKVDGRTAAKKEKFVEVFYRRMGEAQLGRVLNDLTDGEGVINAAFNTDNIPNNDKSFLELYLDGASPEIVKATLEAQERMLSNPALHDAKIVDVMEGEIPTTTEGSFMTAATNLYGPTFASRLVQRMRDIADAQQAQDMPMPDRRMASPSGEKPWGMKVTGAERALPSGNFATEGLSDTNGRFAHFQSLLDDTLNVELLNFKAYLLQRSLDEGYDQPKAEKIATALYYEKLDKMAAGRDGFVERNGAMLNGRIKEIKDGIADLRKAREAYVASYAKLPVKFRSSLSQDTGTIMVRGADGNLVEMETFKYNLTKGQQPSSAEQKLISSHYANLAKLRDVRGRYAKTSNAKVIMKGRNDIPIGDLINAADQEVARLNAKKEGTIKIVSRGMRLTKDTSVHEDTGLADYMGRSQLRDGQGIYEPNGKIQSILKTVGAKGFSGRLVRSGYKKDTKGQWQKQLAGYAHLDEMDRAKIERGTQVRVRDKIEAGRNKDRVQILDYHIELLDNLGRAVATLRKKDEGATYKFKETKSKDDKGIKITLTEAEDRLFAAEQYARNNIVEVGMITRSQSQTLLGGLKGERTQLSTSTEQQKFANEVEVDSQNRGKTLLRKANLEISNRHAALMKQEKALLAVGKSMAMEDLDYMKLLYDMRVQANKLAAHHQRSGTAIDLKRANAIYMHAFTKQGKQRAARRKYLAEVKDGMYDYENSTYGEQDPNYEIDVSNEAANIEFNSRSQGEDNLGSEGNAAYDYLYGGEPTPDQRQQVNTEANQLALNQAAKQEMIEANKALMAKAQNGELSSDELLQALANLNQQVADLSTVKENTTKPVGVKKQPIIATTPSGIEVDLNNDIKYYRQKADGAIRLEIDGKELGRFSVAKNGNASIQHPDGFKVTFSTAKELKQNLVRIFNRQIEEIQLQSKGERFAVKKSAEGAPHVQVDHTKTQTYKNETPTKVETVDGSPEENPPVKNDPENVLTWTAADFDDLPDGRQLAIQFLDVGGRVKKAGIVRPAGMKGKGDSRQPQSIGDLLGQSAGVKYVIGHVQAGGGRSTAQETFFPMNLDDVFLDQNGNGLIGHDVPKGKRGMSAKVQSNRKRENRASKLESVQGNELKLTDADRAFFKRQGEELNYVGDLVNYVERIETMDWQGEIKSLEGLKRYATARAAAARVLKSNVPNGIKKPTTTIGFAMNKLRSMFDGYPQREVQTAVDFLERIAAYNGGSAPILVKSTDGPAFDPNTNAIKVDVGSKDATKERASPMSMELVHEMGHWIYDNLLEEGDRQKFWASMEKYYDDNGMLDFDMLSRGMVDKSLISNAATNPQEFFANQFLGYVLQTDALRVPGSPLSEVFHKVSQLGKALFDYLMGRKTMSVDADLADLFKKFLPEEEIDPLTGAPTRGPSKFSGLEQMGKEHGKEAQFSYGNDVMPAAQFAARQMVALDERIRDLQIAKMASPRGLGDSFALAIELEKIAKSLYGEYGGVKGEAFHKSIPGNPESGSARIQALDYARSKTGGKTILEDVMQAQYKIHGFLKNLRSEEADSKVAQSLAGQNPTDAAQAEAINREMTTDTKRDVQSMYERMLTQSKSAYEGLDEAVVDQLHALSSDLQVAMQRAVGEYTGMFKRTMPRTERKKIAIDQYTGAAYVETLPPKSAMFRNAAIKNNRKVMAIEQSVSEIVEELSKRGIDWRDVGEDAILVDANARSQKLITAEELSNALHNADLAEGADNMGALAQAINELKTRVTFTTRDSSKELAQLEADDSPLLAILRGNDEALRTKTMAALEADPSDFNLALLDYGRKHGATVPDAPDPISTEPLNPAIKTFADRISVRGMDKTEQGIARDLFIKLVRKIKGAEDPQDILDESAETINEFDLAILRGDRTAMEYSDETNVLPEGEDYDEARRSLRAMAKEIRQINEIRARHSDRLETGGYDALVERHREFLFNKLYRITFAMRSRDEQKAIMSLSDQGVQMLKDKFARLSTKSVDSVYVEVTAAPNKAQNEALQFQIDDAVQILDGLLYQPQSMKERKMEVRRMAVADLDKAKRDKHEILGMVINPEGVTLVHPSVAGKYANSYLDNVSPRLDNAVRDFVGLRPEASLRDSFRYNVSADQAVRGVTVTKNGRYGEGVYLVSSKDVDTNYSAAQIRKQVEDDMFHSDAPKDAAPDIDSAMKDIALYREQIRDLANKANPTFDERRLLNMTLQMERSRWDALSNLTNSVDTKVAPAFARIRAPLDVSSKQSYSLGAEEDGSVRHIIMELADKNILDANGVQAAVDRFSEPVSGPRMYDAFTNGRDGLMVTSGTAKSQADAQAKFKNILKDLGYDAMHTDQGDVVFDPSMVKEANSFEATDALLFDGVGFGGDMKLTGQVVEEMMVKNAPLKNAEFVGVAREVRRMGVPAPITKITKKIFNQHKIEGDDVQKISTWSTVKNFFRENSSLMRQLGANWFGDQIKPVNGVGTFEKHDAMLARRLQPIIAKLNELPDAGNNFQRWNRRNRGLAMGALDVGQPASHTRVIQALRRGRGAVAKLKPAEQRVALEIGNAFNDEFNKMKALGIKVGDARKLGSDFYVPQVWDSEAILANPKKFQLGLSEFLRRSQLDPDFDPNERMTPTELGELADMIASKLTRGSDPTVDGDLQAAMSNNPFAARVLALKPGDYDFMDGFLVQDLQGILAKYYDRTIRKRVLTEQFGVNAHAFSAYVDIADGGGVKEAVNILKADYNPNDTVSTESGSANVTDVMINRLTLNPDETKELQRRLQRMLGDPKTAINNKQAAIHMLMEMGDADATRNVQYAKRVEAVVNGLIDFSQGRPPSTTIAKMRAMMNVLNKKPIDGGDGTEARYKVSRLLKSFTSVSLLGFTTFTSIPDVALPLVRSGNMRAFAKTWAKYSTDPSYRAAAKNIGVGIDNLMHERMVHMSGEGNQKFANAFFNLTLLTPWTNTMREVASLVGFESFKSEIDRAMRLKRKGKTDGRSYKTAVRYLERYGLTGENAPHDFLVDGSFRIDALPKNEAVQMQVQMAMMRFTNEAIFTPNPNDVPMWAQTPWGSMMFQLKSFPMLMMKLQGYIMDEFKQGNVAPLAYMLTAGVGAGSISVGVKDFVQMRGGEDENSADFRKRSLVADREKLGEVLGLEEGDDVDAALGWYLDGLLAVGGMGLIGEMLYNTSAQLDNGKYGFVRTMSGIFGPQVGTAELGFNAVAGAGQATSNYFSDEQDKPNDKIRATLRDLFGRIPIAGRVYGGPTGRETFVDAVGGEAKKPGRKKGSGKGKFGDGFASSDFNSSKFGGKFD